MSVVVISVIILFALIFLGFFLGKGKVVSQDSIPDMSNLVINVTLPATVFISIVEQQGQEGILSTLWQMVIATVVMYGVSFLISLLVAKLMRVSEQDRGVWLYTGLLSNNGFMGLPLALAIFGSQGTFVMAIGNAFCNLLIFSVGAKLLTRGYPIKNKISVRKMFVNPVNVAVVAGFIFLFVGIPLPDFASQLLGYIANITTGLSMLVVGLSLSRLAFRDVFTDKKMFFLPVLRLLILPLAMFALFAIIPFEFNPLVKGVVILTAALPASAAQSMITEQYGTNTAASGRAVFITTLFSVVTVPLMMMLAM